MNKRTHVVLEEKLVKDIDRLVGTRRRSGFLTEAAEEKLMRYRQIEALKAAAGAWKDKTTPNSNRVRRNGFASCARRPNVGLKK